MRRNSFAAAFTCTAITLSLATLALGGCQQAPAGSQPGAVTSESESAIASAAPSASSPAPTVNADRPSYSKNPVEALDWWAAAIEARDWSAMRAFWGDMGARSNMDEAAFAAKWDVLRAPKVTIGAGAQEGAAGSLYYTAPITIVDGDRTLRGEVIIRRVNDVDGATTEQLRWHVESLSLPL